MLETQYPPLLSGTDRPGISYLKEWMCRTVDLKIQGRSVVEKTERKMAEMRGILRCHSQQPHIFVGGLAMILGRMRHYVVGRMSETRSAATKTRNEYYHLAAL